MEPIKVYFDKIPRHWITASSAWASKIIVSLVQIVSIRELLLYLGEDRYAVYAVAYSLMAFFSLSNFGIGVALQNFISGCRVKQESEDRYLLAALQISAAITLVALIITIIAASPLQDILFRKFPFVSSSIPIVLAVGLFTIAMAFFQSSYNVFFAKHKGYIPNILPAIAAMCSMAAIVLLNRRSDIPHSIVLALMCFIVPQTFIAFVAFIKIYWKYIPKLFNIDKDAVKNLFTRAAKFQGISIAAILYANVDYIIMSQTVQSTDIVAYNIFTRVFMFAYFIHITWMTAIWPVLSEAYIAKRFKEIKDRMKKQFAYIGSFIIVSTIGILMFSGLIIRVLAPQANISVTSSLIIIMGFYFLVRCFSDIFSYTLQSFNILKIFWILAPFQIVINGAGQYFFSKWFGVQGILMGLTLSFLLTSILFLPHKLKTVLSDVSKRSNS